MIDCRPLASSQWVSRLLPRGMGFCLLLRCLAPADRSNAAMRGWRGLHTACRSRGCMQYSGCTPARARTWLLAESLQRLYFFSPDGGRLRTRPDFSSWRIPVVSHHGGYGSVKRVRWFHVRWGGVLSPMNCCWDDSAAHVHSNDAGRPTHHGAPGHEGQGVYLPAAA